MSENLVSIEGAELSEYAKSISGTGGLENLTSDDLQIPRLLICQTQSPQRLPGRKHIAGLSEGMLFNSVSGERFDKADIVPVLAAKTRKLFRDPKEGKGIKCMSANGINGGHLSPAGCADCACSQWKEEEAP